MGEIILLHFSGQDKPGITSELTALLAECDACVLDIGQAVVHETLALGLLAEFPTDAACTTSKAALTARCEALGLQVRFTPVDQTALGHWIAAQGKDRFLITILGRAITAQQLARASAIIAAHGMNIDRIERLSGRLSLAVHTPHSNACVELHISGRVQSESGMRADF